MNISQDAEKDNTDCNRQASLYRGRGRGCDRGRDHENRSGGRSGLTDQRSGDRSYGSNRGNTYKNIQCCYCKKYGHFEKFCRLKKENNASIDAKYAETDVLFACYTIKNYSENIWYLDSGCSAHITGREDLFIEMDRSIQKSIKMGDGRVHEAQGKGVVKVNFFGITKISDVFYVPRLDANLFSVGQFLLFGYSLVFENSKCLIYDVDKKKKLLAEVPMAF